MATRVRTLSGGQRQALTLLMATLVSPQVLLLDEHTAALDPGAAALGGRPDRPAGGRAAPDRVDGHVIICSRRSAMARAPDDAPGQVILDIGGAERRPGGAGSGAAI